jgi:hypothetical protein
MSVRAGLLALAACWAACGEPSPQRERAAPADAEAGRGLVAHDPARVSPGYVLFAPLGSNRTFLVDNEGRVVHLWRSLTALAGDQMLLADGSLLRLGRDLDFAHFRTGGVGGWLERLAWDGEELWAWRFASARAVTHHDFEPLPNGNVLVLAWERKSPEEARLAGRRVERIPSQGVWADFVLEVKPEPPRGGTIVWEWHVWDHLVQLVDATAETYGDPREHPGKVDLNAEAQVASVSAEELAQLKALGYVPATAAPEDLDADFLHVNALDHHAGLDQIALSVRDLGEVWIVDHGTTTAEARGSLGGKRGRGGEILYRWGNASAFGRGAASERWLGDPHDARWVREGSPGAGRITIFNNSVRGRNAWSAVEEIALPLLPNGLYALAPGEAFAPRAPAWRYEATPRERFHAARLSGAQRTANGNTLVSSGPQGRLFEVTPAGEIVWEYRSPFARGEGSGRGFDASAYAVFRAARIAPDHPALRGRTLAPLDPQPAYAPAPGE